MAIHRLDTTDATAINYFAADLAPVLTVSPGDTLVAHTLDASGHLGTPSADGEMPKRFFGDEPGHCLIGPIAIDGARPGRTLAVRLQSLVPDDWGYTAAATQQTPLNTRLGLLPADGARLLWAIDNLQRTATNQLGLGTTLKPFLGVVGLAPPEPGRHSTIPPRPVGGGNIDCRELGAGSTLYLPISVDGGLLFLGDGHAAQGDGEVSGTAIECGMTTTLSLELVDEPAVSGVYAITPAGRITFGFDADLNAAAATALETMIDWLAREYAIRRSEALGLASVTVSLRVTQIANQTWGVHALLPHGAVLTE